MPSTPNGGDGTLQTRIVRVKLKTLRTLEARKNARYMKGEQFNQLVENLRRDGVLTSLPLVHEQLVLSGNHRVLAAIKAGIEEADIIEIVGTLAEARKLALQLSHNAIAGQDDPSILALLYSDLDLDWKTYSGVNDDVLKGMEELNLASLSAGATTYQDMLITFLPEEATAFLELVKQIEAKGKRAVRLLASLSDFDRFFETTVAVKEKLNIQNTATAVRVMATLAVERLAQLEANEHGEPLSPDAAGGGADPQLPAAG
jgi:hypothetical protein